MYPQCQVKMWIAQRRSPTANSKTRRGDRMKRCRCDDVRCTKDECERKLCISKQSEYQQRVNPQKLRWIWRFCFGYMSTSKRVGRVTHRLNDMSTSKESPSFLTRWPWSTGSLIAFVRWEGFVTRGDVLLNSDHPPWLQSLHVTPCHS